MPRPAPCLALIGGFAWVLFAARPAVATSGAKLGDVLKQKLGNLGGSKDED